MKRLTRLTWAAVLSCALALAGVGLAACTPASPKPTGPCADFTKYGTFTDASVSLASTFTGAEAERLEESLAAFESCTGIDVVHTGSDSMEAQLLSDPQTDLAIVPQSGLVADLVNKGALRALPNSVNANIELGWERSWAEAGTYNGVPYAAPLMASVKSFVWFSPTAFDRLGYEIPTTWADLESLSAQVVKDHPDGSVTPWCLGVSDGDSTGWPVTDWLEDILLFKQGPGVYDLWASHTVPLDAPAAVTALGALDSLVMADGRLPGGRKAAAQTTVEQAGEQLVDGSCLMLHASSSMEGMFPAGTVITDVDGKDGVTVTATGVSTASPAPQTASASTSSTTVSAFLLPSVEADTSPVLVGGDSLVAFQSSEAITAVMDYLTSATWAQIRTALGGVATANRGVKAADIPSDVNRRATELLQSRQTLIRMDASDSMPPAVGTQALWSSLASWASGELSAKAALAQAEAAWPK